MKSRHACQVKEGIMLLKKKFIRNHEFMVFEEANDDSGDDFMVLPGH